MSLEWLSVQALRWQRSAIRMQSCFKQDLIWTFIQQFSRKGLLFDTTST